MAKQTKTPEPVSTDLMLLATALAATDKLTEPTAKHVKYARVAVDYLSSVSPWATEGAERALRESMMETWEDWAPGEGNLRTILEGLAYRGYQVLPLMVRGAQEVED